MIVPSRKPDLGLMHRELFRKSKCLTRYTTVVQTLMKMATFHETDVDSAAARRVIEGPLDISFCAEYNFGLHDFNPPFLAGLLDHCKFKSGGGNQVR